MDQPLITFALIGAATQLIDGSLGMGYKTSAAVFLLGLGIPPVIVSSSIHLAGVPTSAVSGLSHWRMGNVDMTLCRRLVVPGVIGGVVGALLLTVTPAALITPLIAVYLLVMGVRIVRKSMQRAGGLPLHVRIVPLGVAGGFFDAVGGGGWGPIVTSTLMMKNHRPAIVIGSVNTAEFFVTVFQTLAFLLALKMIAWEIVVGLMLGGVITAPIAALIANRLPAQRLMLLVGLLISGLSMRTLMMAVMEI
jgi:hypothetical protein